MEEKETHSIDGVKLDGLTLEVFPELKAGGRVKLADALASNTPLGLALRRTKANTDAGLKGEAAIVAVAATKDK